MKFDMLEFRRHIADNVLSLCVRAGLDALSCQPAQMQNRSTKLDIGTTAQTDANTVN